MVIVAGVDDSPHAVTILERAIDEAVRRGAELHVVHVFNPPTVYMEAPLDPAAIAAAERSFVWGQLEDATLPEGLVSKRVDLEGYPADVLVGYADELKADLVVVGTRGRGEFASLVLGSTSHRTIHLSRCDVLVVKPRND